MAWSKGFAEWVDDDTAYLSVVFTWLLDEAYARALWHRALGRRVRVGGPALFLNQMQHELSGLSGVEVGDGDGVGVPHLSDGRHRHPAASGSWRRLASDSDRSRQVAATQAGAARRTIIPFRRARLRRGINQLRSHFA